MSKDTPCLISSHALGVLVIITADIKNGLVCKQHHVPEHASEPARMHAAREGHVRAADLYRSAYKSLLFTSNLQRHFLGLALQAERNNGPATPCELGSSCAQLSLFTPLETSC